MRVNVKKYLVLGPMSLRDHFFRRVQELGIVEFIQHKTSSLEAPHEIQNFVDALHVLRQMVPVKQAPTDDYRSANVLASHIVERQGELEHLREQARITEQEVARIEVFGEFSLSNLKEIEAESNRKIQFYFKKSNQEIEATKRPEVIYVGSAYALDYYMAINDKPTYYDGMIEIIIEHSLGELRERLAKIHRDIDTFETELATLAHHKKLLKQGLFNALNHYHLESAKTKSDSLLSGEVFAAEGWVPKNKIADLLKLAEEFQVYIEPIQVEKEDKVPTYLENKGAARLGEDLVSIYDTPSKNDRDPSLWVFIAFGLFFSMIIADAGYGLILLCISLFLFYKFGKKKGLGRRVIMLSTSLSIGCIIWGILISSFFGIDLAPNNPIRKISVINWMVEKKAEYLLTKKPQSYNDMTKEYPELTGITSPEEFLMKVESKTEGMSKYVIYNEFTDNVLIELALFIGTIHIILSFLRYLDRNWAGIGWIIFMIGGYLYFPIVLKAISLIHYVFGVPYELGGEIGLYLIFIGLGLAALLGIIQHRLSGLAEIMQVIGVFADVMSYLRIYALSLAGMIMASTFNEMGTSVPFYIGIFIILAGHTINFTLALMGGIIHGLRLNFIEWYHYSFEGGGRKFKPLSLLEID